MVSLEIGDCIFLVKYIVLTTAYYVCARMDLSSNVKAELEVIMSDLRDTFIIFMG